VLDSVYLLLAEGVVSVGKKWHKRRKFDAGANVWKMVFNFVKTTHQLHWWTTNLNLNHVLSHSLRKGWKIGLKLKLKLFFWNLKSRNFRCFVGFSVVQFVIQQGCGLGRDVSVSRRINVSSRTKSSTFWSRLPLSEQCLGLGPVGPVSGHYVSSRRLCRRSPCIL